MVKLMTVGEKLLSTRPWVVSFTGCQVHLYTSAISLNQFVPLARRHSRARSREHEAHLCSRSDFGTLQMVYNTTTDRLLRIGVSSGRVKLMTDGEKSWSTRPWVVSFMGCLVHRYASAFSLNQIRSLARRHSRACRPTCV